MESRPPYRCPRRASLRVPSRRSVTGMTNDPEARDFLTSRRARLTPEQVELPAGGNRRVPGLRRSEVAQLAGVSIEYYSRL